MLTKLGAQTLMLIGLTLWPITHPPTLLQFRPPYNRTTIGACVLMVSVSLGRANRRLLLLTRYIIGGCELFLTRLLSYVLTVVGKVQFKALQLADEPN